MARADNDLDGARCVVIGAGMGGLCAAIALAARGAKVRVLERAPQPGGRAQRIALGGYSFDIGEPYILMPQFLGQVFSAAGLRLNDFLDLQPLATPTRVVMPVAAEGEEPARVDLHREQEALEAEFARFSEIDAGRVAPFLRRAAKLQRASELKHHLLPGGRLSASPRRGADTMLWRGRGLDPRSYEAMLRRAFRHETVRRAMGALTHRLGLSPHQTSAVAMVRGALAPRKGAWVPVGGMGAIVPALLRVAGELGVQIACGREVERIELEGGRVRAVIGIGPDGKPMKALRADVVVSTLDPVATMKRMMPQTRNVQRELSHRQRARLGRSGFLWMVGVREVPALFEHPETIFLPENEAETARQMDQWRVPAHRPPLFVWNGSAATPGLAPESGGALQFFLPMPAHDASRWRWDDAAADRTREELLERLEGLGLEGFEDLIEEERMVTPGEFATDPWRTGGVLFGRRSCGFGLGEGRLAGNGASRVPGLFFAGAWAPPGPILPLIAAGAMRAADGAADDFRTTRAVRQAMAR
ncbi:MAG: NAD(P)/FAD-dependent oxidoreductase [Sumerlaeia bacterium]